MKIKTRFNYPVGDHNIFEINIVKLTQTETSFALKPSPIFFSIWSHTKQRRS